MKKTILVLLLVLFSFYSIAGDNLEITIKSPTDIEFIRRSIARDLLEFNFIIEAYSKNHTIFKSENKNSGYFYQIYVTHNKNKVTMCGYIFMKSGYNWKYKIAHEQAIEYLKTLMLYCVETINNTKHLDKSHYIYSGF